MRLPIWRISTALYLSCRFSSGTQCMSARYFSVFLRQSDHFRRKPCSKFNFLASDPAPAVDGNDRNGVLAKACCVEPNLQVVSSFTE